MTANKIVYRVSRVILVVLVFAFSSCKKCETINLCPSPNAQFIAVHGTDTAALYIPNAITPNGDQINDVFILSGRKIANVKCLIYDDGKLVAELDSLGQEWDGKVNHKVNVRVYSIFVTGTTTYGDVINMGGTVSVISGQFLGLNSDLAYGHVNFNIAKAQFPTQSGNGIFNSNLPTEEYLLIQNVDNCN